MMQKKVFAEKKKDENISDEYSSSSFIGTVCRNEQ